MLDKLLKGAKGEEDCGPEMEMPKNPKLAARKELLKDLQKMAMSEMKRQGDDIDAVKASVTVAQPGEEAQDEALESGAHLEPLDPGMRLAEEAKDPMELGDELSSPEEGSEHQSSVEELKSLKQRIAELEAKLAPKV